MQADLFSETQGSPKHSIRRAAIKSLKKLWDEVLLMERQCLLIERVRTYYTQLCIILPVYTASPSGRADVGDYSSTGQRPSLCGYGCCSGSAHGSKYVTKWRGHAAGPLVCSQHPPDQDQATRIFAGMLAFSTLFLQYLFSS